MQNMGNTKNENWDVGDLLIYLGWMTPLEHFNLFYYKNSGKISYNNIPNCPKLMDRTQIKKGAIFLIIDTVVVPPNTIRLDLLFDNKHLHLLMEDGSFSHILKHFKKIESTDEQENS